MRSTDCHPLDVTENRFGDTAGGVHTTPLDSTGHEGPSTAADHLLVEKLRCTGGIGLEDHGHVGLAHHHLHGHLFIQVDDQVPFGLGMVCKKGEIMISC
jgi:hypothetical protein